MSKKSQAVISWRNRTKSRMVESMGGECQICGYNRCSDSLEFHHINPDEKELKFSGIRANPKKWNSICDELKKCILLCSNCHKEVESGMTKLPETFKKFDESYRDYKTFDGIYVIRKCLECNTEFKISRSSKKKFCNTTCSSKHNRKVERPSITDLILDLQTMSYREVGKKYGVSDNAIRKWSK